MENHEMEQGQEQEKNDPVVEEMNRVIKQEEKKEWMLPASIVFAAIMISAAFIYSSGAKNVNPAEDQKAQIGQVAPQITEGDAVLGKADAPVTIIEYGDFQCPGCVAFFMTGEPLIKKELVETGKAKLVFRPYPIVDQIVGKGSESYDSSLALLCARDQGKFWEMHNGLYSAEAKDEEIVGRKGTGSPEGNGNLDRALFIKIAENVGMQADTFASCYDSRARQDELDAIIAQAQEIGVQGTPTLFINGKQVDMRQYRSWQDVVAYAKSLAQ